MKKIAVTGTNGFIGSRFLDIFASDYSITSLTRQGTKSSPETQNITNLEFDMAKDHSSLKSIENFDCFIHLAYDSADQAANKIGLSRIIAECLEHKIKRLIHVSTVSVYNPFIEGEMNERCPYTSLTDPYSKTKKDLEVFLKKKIRNTALEVIILQPTIVYGLGGSWTKTAFSAACMEKIALPNNGDLPCNCIYVDDVADAINSAVLAPLSSGKVTSCLISGPGNVTWHQFYDSHAKILQQELGTDEPAYFATSVTRKYHPSRLQNLIIGLIISPLSLGIPGKILSRLRKKSGAGNSAPRVSFGDKYKQATGIYHPTALARMATSSHFIVNRENGKKNLNFYAKTPFDTGMNNLKKKITEIMRQKND